MLTTFATTVKVLDEQSTWGNQGTAVNLAKQQLRLPPDVQTTLKSEVAARLQRAHDDCERKVAIAVAALSGLGPPLDLGFVEDVPAAHMSALDNTEWP
jgi:hypothetical protein